MSAPGFPLAPGAGQAIGAAGDRPVRPDFLLFSPPSVGDDEIHEVSEALRSGWITTGPRTQQFEAAFRDHVGAPAALALNSCTAAMHTALAALGVGPGDEVITTPLTFAATGNVVEHVGARLVLADVEPDILTLDPAAVEAAITPRTRAILVVHYAGHPADLDALGAVAARHGIPIVEDAAHALPARYRGRWIGAGQNPVAFSFYATKNLTTGEGGMLTGSHEFVARCRPLSLHGMTRDAWRRYARGGSWHYDVVAPGFKYNMTDIQAALGLVQLRRLAAFQARREAIAAAYTAAFALLPGVDVPTVRPWAEPAWHLYVLRLPPHLGGKARDAFIARLADRNIGTSVHFIPLHLHQYYRERYGWSPSAFPVALAAYERMVSLPLHPLLTDDDVADVIAAVTAVLGEELA